MAESIGRESLQELIKLQIELLQAYEDVLDSDKWSTAKTHLNKAIKAAIEAVEPILALQHTAADKGLDLHRKAVEQTRELLKKLLEEEKERAALHQKMRERAERSGPRP